MDKEYKLLVFSATWCGHCREMHPKIEEAIKTQPKVVLEFIDVDTCDAETLDKWGVDELPAIIMTKDDKFVSRYQESDGTLESWLNFCMW